MPESKQYQVRNQNREHEMEVRAKVSKTSSGEDPESFDSFHNPVPGTSSFMDIPAGPSSSSCGGTSYQTSQNLDTAAFSSSSSSSCGGTTYQTSQNLDTAAFSSSSEDDDDDNADSLDRESLIKDIDDDIKRLIERSEEVPTNSSDYKDVKVKKKLKEPDDEAAKPALFMVKLSGRDGAEYSLQIFMRNAAFCRNRRERASRNDPRVPLIVDREGKVNAIVPAGHKLLLLCQRRATKPSQFIPRGSFVLFRFYVDGEALSEGELHEATIKEPAINWAKDYIDTHPVGDQQRVEHAHEANAHVGTFVVKVFTKLKETLVTEQFSTVPEDDRVFEKTKRRICCAVPPPDKDDSESAKNGNKTVKTYEAPTAGLAAKGAPAAVLEVSYDDLLGTRSRHWGQKEFQLENLQAAGVDEAMLREAYPLGVPQPIRGEETIDLTEEEDLKTEIKEEAEP